MDTLESIGSVLLCEESTCAMGRGDDYRLQPFLGDGEFV